MNSTSFDLEIKNKINPYNKNIKVDSDKSISIRCFIVSAISQNISIIKNVLGYRGSVTSDFIFQSVGLIGYLLPITYIITGINIFRKKEILVIIENTFFITIYILSSPSNWGL